MDLGLLESCYSTSMRYLQCAEIIQGMEWTVHKSYTGIARAAPGCENPLTLRFVAFEARKPCPCCPGYAPRAVTVHQQSHQSGTNTVGEYRTVGFMAASARTASHRPATAAPPQQPCPIKHSLPSGKQLHSPSRRLIYRSKLTSLRVKTALASKKAVNHKIMLG